MFLLLTAARPRAGKLVCGVCVRGGRARITTIDVQRKRARASLCGCPSEALTGESEPQKRGVLIQRESLSYIRNQISNCAERASRKLRRTVYGGKCVGSWMYEWSRSERERKRACRLSRLFILLEVWRRQCNALMTILSYVALQCFS